MSIVSSDTISASARLQATVSATIIPQVPFTCFTLSLDMRLRLKYRSTYIYVNRMKTAAVE